MARSLYILIFLTLIGCTGTDEALSYRGGKEDFEVFAPGFPERSDWQNLGLIQVDSLKNFGHLMDEMENLSCQNKSIGLRFSLRDTVYYATGFADCPTDGFFGCYFNRNKLLIKNDSLINLAIDPQRQVAIEDLYKELRKIVGNTDCYQSQNKQRLNRALIFLHIDDDHPISQTKSVLGEIARGFARINEEHGAGFFDYFIRFERYSVLDLPAPPPPPEGFPGD